MQRPTLQVLTGERLHLQHGPIDVVLKAWGEAAAVRAAYEAAAERFQSVLDELTAELRELRKPMDEGPVVAGTVARRMVAACRPFAEVFVTPMAAVAGSVSDELLACMQAAGALSKAFVNDGGDIAIHLAPGESIGIGVASDFAAGPIPRMGGSLTVPAAAGIGGVATSGRHGRSFSFGIADSVTVLARDAATADVAATLIGDAVDIDSEAVVRMPACELDPDSDLGPRLVTVEVGALSVSEIDAALAAGRICAESYVKRGLITAAAMTLVGRDVVVGAPSFLLQENRQ